jgi:hypothetical protein
MANIKTKFIVKIDNGSLKVLKCEFKNKQWQVNSRFVEILDQDISGSQITEKLRDILKKLKFKNEPVVIVIGRKMAVTRYIGLPTTDKREITKMLEFWAPRCLPYPLEELSSGWASIDSKDGYSKIMLSVVQRKEIEKVFTVLPVKAEQIEGVFLDSYGLAAWLVGSSPVMGVNIDDTAAQIVIAKGGKLLFSRIASLDLNPIRSKNILFEEVDKSIQAYQRENIDACPSRIFFYGKVSQEMKAEIKLGNKFEVNVSLEHDVECLGLLGLKEATLNLATADFLAKKENRISELHFKRSLGLAALLLVFFIFGAQLYIRSQESYLEGLEKKIENISAEGRQLDAMYNALEQLGSQNTRKPVLLDLWSQLYKLLPSTVTLKTFSYQRSKEFVLKGRADNLLDALNAISILEKSGNFSGLKVNYAGKSENVSGDSVGFQITGHFKSKNKT